MMYYIFHSNFFLCAFSHFGKKKKNYDSDENDNFNNEL